MATAPNTPLESVEEYLNNSYSPDVEYVNGLLVERGMPTIAHGTLAPLLAGYFLAFRHEFGIAVVVECRTRIVEGARYRIPDVLLCGSLPDQNDVPRDPLPNGKVIPQ